MAEPLRVRPVERYRVPLYPSHADPDPTLYPYPVPFPFRRELVRAAAGFGIAAALGCGPRERPALVFEDPQNPFLLGQSGLPHQSSPFGTGAPTYVDDATARTVIERVFRDEGFSLEENVSYARDGVAFRTTGYDPERGIGYVFGDWGTLDEDALNSWQVTEPDPLPPDDPEAIRKWLACRWALRPASKRIQEEMARILDMTDGKELAEAFRKLRPEWHAELLSMEEARRLEVEAPAKKEFVAVISAFDERLRIERTARESTAHARLALLERNVREYIAWARAQGLQ